MSLFLIKQSLGIIIILAILIIAFFIIYIINSSKRIEILSYKIENKEVKINNFKTTEGIKIVFFSDIHLGRTLKKAKLIEKIKVLKELNADLYIFGGDIIGNNIKKYYTLDDVKECFTPLLNKTCLAVYGNHEFKKIKNITSKEQIYYINSMGFKVLNNEYYTFKKDNKEIKVFGFNEHIYHNNDFVLANDADIVISHEGDIVNNLENKIVISGHTHGGQIRLKYIPFFYKPKLGKKYINGLYKINNNYLIVSKGIGFNLIKVRLNALSDIIVLDYK